MPDHRAAIARTLLAVACLGCNTSGPRPLTRGGETMFRGDPRHTGVYETGMGARFAGLRWRVRTEGPVRSTPAVVDGAVYVGSADGHLYALDAGTGTIRWKADGGSAINSSPAVAGGRVIVGTQRGDVIAVDQGTGSPIWRAAIGADMPLAWGHESGDPLYTSSPTIVGETVLIGSGDGRLVALDVRDGRLRWALQTGGRVRSTPAVDRGTVYVGSLDGSLYAVDAATGKQLWRFDTEGRSLNSAQFGFDRRTIQSSPAVNGDLVVVGARDGFLYAVDRVTGKLRWRVDHKISWVNGSAAVEGDAVYSGTSDGRFFQRVDPATGKEVWRDSSLSVSFASSAVVGDVVYAVDASGTLYVRDKRTGTERWRYSVGEDGSGDAIWSSPVPSDSVVYFGSDNGFVYAVQTTAGSPLRRAVYWDSAYTEAANFPQHRELRSYLTARGYQALRATELGHFMRDRVADGSPSVVVCAIDYLPPDVAPVAADTVLLRRYLDKGGKIIWLGQPPLLWPRDPKTFDPVDLTKVQWDAPMKLLGVDVSRGTFHPMYRATPTGDGERWGLDGWWLSAWAADPGTVTTTLATDENGRAASWVRRYGGPPGTGFVALYGGYAFHRGRLPLDFRSVQMAAEYAPR